jgi:ABC-type transport system substrate-binding protein
VKLAQVDLVTYNSIFFGSEPPGKRPNLLPNFWYPDYDDPYDQCVPLVASYSAGAAGGNGGYYHNKQVDALLAQMKYAGRTLLIRDAQKLQGITGRVDPPALWIAEPAEVTILARSLKGYVFNPLEPHTYYFYTMHR